MNSNVIETPGPGFRWICNVALSVVLLSAGGCGEFAYKRGASSSDLESAKNACKVNAPDTASFEKCMAAEGWTLKNLSKMGSLDDDPVIEATLIPSDRRIENASTTAPQDGHVDVAASPHKPKPDMMDTFKISSWWKAGSGAGDLKADTDDCVATLGEPHRPDSGTQYATRGLLLCMKEKGWSGLRAK